MANTSFMERFRGRMSVIGRSGEVEITPGRAVGGSEDKVRSKEGGGDGDRAVSQERGGGWRKEGWGMDRRTPLPVFAQPIHLAPSLQRDFRSDYPPSRLSRLSPASDSLSTHRVFHSIDFPPTFELPRSNSKMAHFSPFTLKDYALIQIKEPSWPANVGPVSRQRKLKLLLQQRREDYSKRIKSGGRLMR